MVVKYMGGLIDLVVFVVLVGKGDIAPNYFHTVRALCRDGFPIDNQQDLCSVLGV